ncbi:argininosuccinate lyase [Seinonella peptonophila]|uniref:Argininosuccinate lyase n=1 Tax=Seinonella peptonophila TaxID=112248 RepID=A0A1M4XPS2_9BACL|nr:argininosuccinate lyase [Seinonella peptonophila]SHE95465.1 argininosuccinate lyase [Seinonella peptonophila]
MKLWGGRFTKETNQLVEAFNASILFDQQLAEEDIAGSLAHVAMLGRCGIIAKEEAEQIKEGLITIRERIRRGEIEFRIEDEDIHMNIERLLIEEIGPVGGKLHTGRSRNDQAQVDFHLYVRRQTVQMVELLVALQEALLSQAREHVDTILSGYTHLQKAQPVRLAHHLIAYVSMFERDIERLIDSYKRVDLCPLGAGAMAGTTFPIDRHDVAEQLGFARLYDNSMDAVSDRDYVVEFLAHSSLIMVHLSRLAEELILWSSDEFRYIELDDAFCTGSSMMPQKKNPDIPELVRGKSGRVIGHLMGILTTIKGLPLTYNKDLQEDKEGLFDTVHTLQGSLQLMAQMIATMTVNKKRMASGAESGFTNATDLADYLVNKGLPFREAHEVVGRLVLHCIQEKKTLNACSLSEFQQFSSLVEEDIFKAISLEQVVEARKSYGGTARVQVEATWKRKQKQIEAAKVWLHEKSQS